MYLFLYFLTQYPPILGSCAVFEQQGGMATLKDISFRLKSVKNIQKITKSMKMVAAAKYAKAEPELKCVQAYGIGAQTFFDNIGGPLTDAVVGTAMYQRSFKKTFIYFDDN